MFKITSLHPLTWPQYKFKLKLGENAFPSRSRIPEAIWPKLERFARTGVVTYEGAPKATEPGKTEPASNVQLSEAGLAKLSLEQLRQLAAELKVDVSAFKSKKDTAAAILDAANGE